MKYLELADGGAVCIGDICAVTAHEVREPGQSWGREVWEVYAHLRSGAYLTIVRVETPKDGEPRVGNLETQRIARAHAEALVRLMLEADDESPYPGELVTLRGAGVLR